MANNDIILALQNGQSTEPLKAGQSNIVKAKSGEHYRVVRLAEGKAPLQDNVIVKKVGENLQLNYADGTKVTLENYYIECKAASSCDLTLPKSAGEYQLDGTTTQGMALGDGTTLIYAHGAPDALMSMAQGNGVLSSTLSGLQGSELTYLPASPIPASAPASSSGSSWLLSAVGGLGIAGGGSDSPAAAAAHDIVS